MSLAELLNTYFRTMNLTMIFHIIGRINSMLLLSRPKVCNTIMVSQSKDGQHGPFHILPIEPHCGIIGNNIILLFGDVITCIKVQQSNMA